MNYKNYLYLAFNFSNDKQQYIKIAWQTVSKPLADCYALDGPPTVSLAVLAVLTAKPAAKSPNQLFRAQQLVPGPNYYYYYSIRESEIQAIATTNFWQNPCLVLKKIVQSIDDRISLIVEGLNSFLSKQNRGICRKFDITTGINKRVNLTSHGIFGVNRLDP